MQRNNALSVVSQLDAKQVLRRLPLSLSRFPPDSVVGAQRSAIADIAEKNIGGADSST